MPPRWYRWARPARNRSAWPEMVAAAVAALMYARTLGFGFVFDDHSLIGPEGPLWVGGPWIPYRPLRHASFWFDHYVGAGAAWPYHFGNVALHAGAGMLVVRLGRRAGASAVVALACALPFLLHPLAVEAVAYVSGRRDLLASVLGLAAVLAWTGRGGSAAAMLLVMAAVASKEAALLVLPQLFAASLCGLGMSVRRAAAPLAAAGVAAILLPVAYGARGPLAPTGSLASNLALAGAVATHYAGNLVAPLSLAVDYPALRCQAGNCSALLTGAATATGMLLIGAVAGCGVLLVRRSTRAAAAGDTSAIPQPQPGARRFAREASMTHRSVRSSESRGDWLLFSFLWAMSWLVALSFVIGTHEPGADRHAYPLLAALAVLSAAAMARVRPTVRAASAAALALWLAWTVPLAGKRIDIWQDDLQLWTHEARNQHASARVHHNLASELAARHRYGKARRELKKALAIDARYWPSELGLAGIDCVRGRVLCAGSHLAAAARAGAPPEQTSALPAACGQRAAVR